MKPQLDTRQYFNNLSDEEKYELFHKTQLTVQRLERIIEDLRCWKDGTIYHRAEFDFESYLKGE
jgi:transcriptional regulator of NAD metabolism